jgi:exodeoxyribonuclease V alpha subunit
MPQELEGVVESVLFSSAQSGYTVLRLRVSGPAGAPAGASEVTAVGNLASPVPGERLHLKGHWTEHPRFGRQFSVEQYESYSPGTAEGIERYLASGLIPGIGPRLARRIVQAFGERTLEVLDRDPGKLAQVEGIGNKRSGAIADAWKQQREIRSVMIFLQSYGVGTALAAKIYQRYGDHAIAAVRENPYRLAMDVAGIGFLTADRMAQRLGLPPESPARAQAGLLHVLRECAAEGHVYYPRIPLLQRCQRLLQIDREIIAGALEGLRQEGRLIVEPGAGGLEEAIYLPAMHTAEAGIASALAQLQVCPRSFRPIDLEKALPWVQARMEINLADRQVQALRTALQSKVSIITGGPGTGKTTILRALLAVLHGAGAVALLAAPTGRAAKRMREATGQEARTIHRLLEYAPGEAGFRRDREHPLHCDWLILDEASMIDAVLMYHLLKALPPSSSLVLVGDADQLPSVGPGCVLRDVIRSGRVPVVELNEVFRQAQASQIVVNAHRLNLGLMPSSQEESDFYFIQQEDPEEVVRVILKLCQERIPRRFHLDPIADIQVLSPMHRGQAGVANLNRVLQEALNPGRPRLEHGERFFAAGDKVMQVRNDYDKEVFNGDVGRVESIDLERRSLAVRYDEQRVGYEAAELDQLALAYAVSVHKSQGCEFPAVIVPVLIQHYLLLRRNLIYTAVTRGKRLVVLVGARKALAMALKNADTQERYTGLRARLAAPAASG